MLKKLGIMAALLVSPGVFAADSTFSDLIKTPEGGKALTALLSQQKVPNWVRTGGVESPVRNITLKGTPYQLYAICKPHNCNNQQFAVLYSAKLHQMSGLYLQNDEKTHREVLQWLNISDELSIDGKTVLYAATTGSLENHPNSFNYSDK